MKYFLTVYISTVNPKDSGFFNVITDKKPIQWLIDIKNNMLPTNPNKYILINGLEISDEEAEQLEKNNE